MQGNVTEEYQLMAVSMFLRSGVCERRSGGMAASLFPPKLSTLREESPKNARSSNLKIHKFKT